jgi:hypothetical protein
VEPQTTLVGTESRVELNPIPTVDLEIALVILPSDTELDNTLGDGDDRQSSLEIRRGQKELGSLKRVNELIISLLKFWLRGKVGHVEV